MKYAKRFALAGLALALALSATPTKAYTVVTELIFPTFKAEAGFIPRFEQVTGAHCDLYRAWAANGLIIVACSAPKLIYAVERDGSIWSYHTAEDLGAHYFGKAIGWHVTDGPGNLVLEFDGYLAGNYPLTIAH